MSAATEPSRAAPWSITRWAILRTVAGSGAPSPISCPSSARARVASAIAAWAHFAALPCSPAAAASPSRIRLRNSSGVDAIGTSVKVLPMSTPA